jgi:3-hydroxybutyryl-CoA dehydrogenase
MINAFTFAKNKMIMINKIGVAGGGAMGSGIAQISAQSGFQVVIFDTNPETLVRARNNCKIALEKLEEKGKIEAGSAMTILNKMNFSTQIEEMSDVEIFIEAIPEDLVLKQNLFKSIQEIVSPETIIASNTSSLSIASISSALKNPERFIGVHFFNPATLMPLVEIIPSLSTGEEAIRLATFWINQLKKTIVIAKDTPGFIVNRLARPYYGEALKIVEEQLASYADVDFAMKELGFKMGPFELMDFIGHDVNFRVTETVWTQMFFDPRYKPSLIQKRLFESGYYGKKSGRGYYHYHPDGSKELVQENLSAGLKKYIQQRILCMLVNEAAEALFLGIASADHLDLAMIKGVNYPKGLLAWGDEIGAKTVLMQLDNLYDEYKDDRYRASVLLRRRVAEGRKLLE